MFRGSPRLWWGASVIVVELLDRLGGEVVEILVRAFGVEPDDPFSGRKLDLVDVAPRALPADEFVLERPDGGLGASALSSASPTEPTEGSTPSSMSRWVKATEVYWLGSTGRCNTGLLE